jgi:hypothetical protein
VVRRPFCYNAARRTANRFFPTRATTVSRSDSFRTEPRNYMRLSVKKVAHNCSRPVLRRRKSGSDRPQMTGCAYCPDCAHFTRSGIVPVVEILEMASRSATGSAGRHLKRRLLALIAPLAHLFFCKPPPLTASSEASRAFDVQRGDVAGHGFSLVGKHHVLPPRLCSHPSMHSVYRNPGDSKSRCRMRASHFLRRKRSNFRRREKSS